MWVRDLEGPCLLEEQPFQPAVSWLGVCRHEGAMTSVPFTESALPPPSATAQMTSLTAQGRFLDQSLREPTRLGGLTVARARLVQECLATLNSPKRVGFHEPQGRFFGVCGCLLTWVD